MLVPPPRPDAALGPKVDSRDDLTERRQNPPCCLQLEKIAPVGNAPTFLSREDLQKVAPAWYDMALDVYR